MLKAFRLIEVELVSMGPPTEWGPGQIAPVAPPLSSPGNISVKLQTTHLFNKCICVSNACKTEFRILI